MLSQAMFERGVKLGTEALENGQRSWLADILLYNTGNHWLAGVLPFPALDYLQRIPARRSPIADLESAARGFCSDGRGGIFSR